MFKKLNQFSINIQNCQIKFNFDSKLFIQDPNGLFLIQNCFIFILALKSLIFVDKFLFLDPKLFIFDSKVLYLEEILLF